MCLRSHLMHAHRLAAGTCRFDSARPRVPGGAEALAGAPGFALRAGLKANSCPADEGERARPFRVQAELCVPGVLSAALEVSPSGGRRGHVLGHWQQRWRRRPRTSGVAARVRCGRGRRAPREYHEAPQEAGWTPCCATDNSPVLALPGGAC